MWSFGSCLLVGGDTEQQLTIVWSGMGYKVGIIMNIPRRYRIMQNVGGGKHGKLNAICQYFTQPIHPVKNLF